MPLHLTACCIRSSSHTYLWTCLTSKVANALTSTPHPQQFYGAGQYRLVGVVLQRALVICVAASVPIYMLWMKTAYVLESFGIETSLAEDVSSVVHLLSIGLIPCFIFDCLRKYLTCQGIVSPAFYSILISVRKSNQAYIFARAPVLPSLDAGPCSPVLLVQIVLHYGILTMVVERDVLGIGYAGGALALALGNFFMVFFLCVYIFHSGIWRKTWIIEPGTWHGDT